VAAVAAEKKMMTNTQVAFFSNCLSALLVEPSFYPINRIAPSLQDQMVLQEARNQLQRSCGVASRAPA